MLLSGGSEGEHTYLEKNLSLFHFIDYKSYTFWPGIEPELPHLQDGD
jgi:hypothetical protein